MVEELENTNEEQIETILFAWLSNNYIPCWTNRKHPTIKTKFTTKGNTTKPDMIIRTTKGYIAIEIKNANEARNIYDATKIIEYMRNYTTKKTTYHINNQEIKIIAFIIATQHSPKGKLFNEEEKKENTTTHVRHPKTEYKRTHQYIRQLWGNWRVTRTYEDQGIGILLSNTLDNDKQNKPMIFYQNKSIDQRTGKERWWVLWEIP